MFNSTSSTYMLTVTSLMDPPIEDSIRQLAPGRWLLGSCYVCEIVSKHPKDIRSWEGDNVNVWRENNVKSLEDNSASSERDDVSSEEEDDLKSWKGDNGIYILRKLSAKEKFSIPPGQRESSRLIHHAGTSAAVWSLGDVFIKVKAWRLGMQLESSTIGYVNKHTSIPTPEVIHSWIDANWNRSFLILKSLKGRTLFQAWQTLSINQRTKIAIQVAKFCRILASLSSVKLETVDGKGIVEPYLTAPPSNSEPSWKPQLLGPYSSSQLLSYLGVSDINKFFLYHADLGPPNIIVDENGNIIGVVDWESAAYYPLFWICTKPLVSAGFYVLGKGAERLAWATLLTEELEKEGLLSDMEKYQAWKKAIGK
jgi:hypothetical protein